jgi:hypothetical protein
MKTGDVTSLRRLFAEAGGFECYRDFLLTNLCEVR